ncbi:hypothetical protein D3C77_481530 [compost metagenome]
MDRYHICSHLAAVKTRNDIFALRQYLLAAVRILRCYRKPRQIQAITHQIRSSHRTRVREQCTHRSALHTKMDVAEGDRRIPGRIYSCKKRIREHVLQRQRFGLLINA